MNPALPARRAAAACLLMLGLPACRERAVPATINPTDSGPAAAPATSTDSSFDRRPDEPLATFVQRLIPGGAVRAHAPLEFVRAGQDTSIVLLYRDSTSQSNYSGVVLTPVADGPGRYRRSHLPAMDEAPGLFEITVRALFVSATPIDTAPALVVQYEYYRTGSGESPGVANTVYGWRSAAFGVDTAATSAVRGLRAVQAIRAKLQAGSGSPPRTQE